MPSLSSLVKVETVTEEIAHGSDDGRFSSLFAGFPTTPFVISGAKATAIGKTA